MAEVIVFADLEAELVTHLSSTLGVPVSTRVPTERPESFVRVTRVGGTRRDRFRDAGMVVVDCWADTSPAAAELAQLARAHVYNLPDAEGLGVTVYRVQEVGGVMNNPDPDSSSPRYTFTAQVTYRGEALT